MPTLHFPGEITTPGQFSPSHAAGVWCCPQMLSTFNISRCGTMPSAIADCPFLHRHLRSFDKSRPRQAAAARKSPIHQRAPVAGRVFHSQLKIGTGSVRISFRLAPALPTLTTFVAVSPALPGCENKPATTGDALNHDPALIINNNAHFLKPLIFQILSSIVWVQFAYLIQATTFPPLPRGWQLQNSYQIRKASWRFNGAWCLPKTTSGTFVLSMGFAAP